MAEIIEETLMLAKSGMMIDSPEKIELSALVEDSWDSVDTKRATLEIEDSGSLSADPGRSRQLFENVIRNAIEHGGEDVSITVGEVEGGYYFADDGPGIPPDDRDEVFEAGYSSAEQGTGLGLSIVKHNADAHGWNVRVTEGSKGGARFEISGIEFSAE